jgi:hypothetical protein
MLIPDPDLDFLPIPDPGAKKALDPRSGSATLLACKLNFAHFLLNCSKEHTEKYLTQQSRKLWKGVNWIILTNKINRKNTENNTLLYGPSKILMTVESGIQIFA